MCNHGIALAQNGIRSIVRLKIQAGTGIVLRGFPISGAKRFQFTQKTFCRARFDVNFIVMLCTRDRVCFRRGAFEDAGSQPRFRRQQQHRHDAIPLRLISDKPSPFPISKLSVLIVRPGENQAGMRTIVGQENRDRLLNIPRRPHVIGTTAAHDAGHKEYPQKQVPHPVRNE